MACHNPFLKNGLLVFPDNGSVVRHVEKWAKVRGDKLAYRFVDFSTERDGVARDLNWAQFSVRNRAIAARLQQVTQPGDRVAILCPQNLEYIVAFFGTIYSGRIAVPLFDPSEPGHVGRLHAVLDDCQPSTRYPLRSVPPGSSSTSPPTRSRTCSTRPGRRASRPACRSPTSTWPPTSCRSSRHSTARRATAAARGCRSSTTWASSQRCWRR